MPDPIELDGWRITVRRGKHGGFVGYASHTATMRNLDTFEHRGKGARQRAVEDVMVQTRISDTLREASQCN